MIFYKFVISLVNDKTRCVTTANGNDSKFERRKGSADSINYTDVTSRFLVRTVRVIFTTKTSDCFRRQKVMILFFLHDILFSHAGLQSNQVAKRLKSCVYKFYSRVNLKIISQNTRCTKSFFSYKDRINRSQQYIYRANYWDCNGFCIGKTKRRLNERKTEHFKALTKHDNTSAIADHVKTTGHNIKWDHFDILAKGSKQTIITKSKRPYLLKNLGQLSTSTSEVKS